MRILAIESSALVASVAIVEEEQIIAEYTMNYKKTHSQTLMPMLEEISKMLELDMDSIDAIAISGGPGSFTGLRIGSATAKGIGLALNKPIVNVPTLAAMAYNAYGITSVICPIMDARRGQVYTGLYTFDDLEFKTIMDQDIIMMEELIEHLNEMGMPVMFLGDGVENFKSTIEEKLKVKYSFAPAHISRQRASAVAALGINYYNQGKTETAAEYGPDYLRLSQAERELKERQEANK